MRTLLPSATPAGFSAHPGGKHQSGQEFARWPGDGATGRTRRIVHHHVELPPGPCRLQRPHRRIAASSCWSSPAHFLPVWSLTRAFQDFPVFTSFRASRRALDAKLVEEARLRASTGALAKLLLARGEGRHRRDPPAPCRGTGQRAKSSADCSGPPPRDWFLGREQIILQDREGCAPSPLCDSGYRPFPHRRLHWLPSQHLIGRSS